MSLSSSHTVDFNWLSPANLLLTLTPSFDDLFLSTLFSIHILPFLKTHVSSHPTQRQIVFEVIGRRLVKEHFSGMVDTPQILEKPFMTNDVKMKLIEEFKDILTEYIVKSAKEAELIKDPTVTEFQKTLRSTYENELNTFKASKKLSLDLQEDEIRRRTTSSHSAGPLIPLHLTGRRKENRVECYNEVGSALTSLLKGAAFQIHPKSVPFEIMDYFCGEGFLERVPLVVFNKVVGRIWPGSLRRYAYEIHLRLGGRDFRTVVVNAAAEKNIEDPTFTSINFLLSHSLKTAIEESMDEENEGVIFEFARRVLNMFYTMTGKNSLQMSYTLLPFIWQFKAADEYEMCGLFGEFFSRHMSLPTSEVAAAAQSLLMSLDPVLHQHLAETFVKNRPASEAQHEAAFNDGEKKIEALFREMVDICFVSLLNSTQLAFVWDHNFLYGWRNSCCALFCVDILVLQRQKLVYFEGDVAACLKKLRQNRNHILTSQLMERFKYYREKGLIPDIDASTFADDEDVGEEGSGVVSSPRQGSSKLPLLFNFHDKDYKLPEITPSGDLINHAESPRFNELMDNYDAEIVERMGYLVMMVQENSAATNIQSLYRGRSIRQQFKEGNYWENKSRAAEMRAKRDATAKASLLLRRMMKGAIARRRVKKMKAERAVELKRKGLRDDTKDKSYEVVFEGEGSLGFTLRACSEDNLEEAKQHGLVGGKISMEKPLPEVSTVKEDSRAEKKTIAPGDLLLSINEEVIVLKKLKKTVKKAREGGAKATFKFMRGLRVRVGAHTALA
ncbi:hypothetical protein TL16_g07034 [Triparma laevis f. inornata]|uniref:PDZ domain-containing protein n=1 Tax=Triparma laevis f. inornata TaxID=1714386 RepID=A0A9W7AYM9_9STRA|nr:hypothetical protein TL16_g07034 [Triparma laevis f. inornata]